MSDRTIAVAILSVIIGVPLLMIALWGFWFTVACILIVFAIGGFR